MQLDFLKDIDWSRYTFNVIGGYVISWLYFFMTLSFFTNTFGKIKGGAINYGMSWLVWLGAIYLLNTYHPGGKGD